MAEMRMTVLGVFEEKLLVVCGVSCEFCVRSFIHGAFLVSEDDDRANFFAYDA
jgi:hypothetical protein